MVSKAILVIILACFAFPASSQSSEKALPTGKVDDLAWLAGCWETTNVSKQLRIVEQWMSPEGGAMLGMSRTVRAGKMTGYEFLRIVSDAGSVKYISRPSQNTSDTDFRAVKLSSNEVTFENLQHDFPQRVMYRRNGDKLTARIEGTANGKIRGIDFPYVRISCE